MLRWSVSPGGACREACLEHLLPQCTYLRPSMYKGTSCAGHTPRLASEQVQAPHAPPDANLAQSFLHAMAWLARDGLRLACRPHQLTTVAIIHRRNRPLHCLCTLQSHSPSVLISGAPTFATADDMALAYARRRQTLPACYHQVLGRHFMCAVILPLPENRSELSMLTPLVSLLVLEAHS